MPHARTTHPYRKTQMNKLKFALISILCLTTAIELFSQVNLCEEKESYHPVDQKLFRIRDSLSTSKIDTIIIYSHWIHTNGFNGYGRVLWRQNGKTYCLRVSYKKATSPNERYEIMKLENDSIFTYFFENKIDTIKTNPDNQKMRVSHDGRHFFQITWNKENYCFLIPDLLVQFNPDNKRVHLINLFKEKGTDTIIIDRIRVNNENGSKTKKRKNRKK